MATRQAFVDALTEVYYNHGVYIGAANGELTQDLTIGKIYELEKSYGGNVGYNVKRDLAFIGNCYGDGINMGKSRAGDCSGIIVGVMRDLGIIKANSDYRARDLQDMAVPVDLKNLEIGDLVFDKLSEATHVGTYTGDGAVIESRGRDYGVVKRKLSEGKWIIGGRLSWFDDPVIGLTRNLKYVKGNMMRGNDVKQIQHQLSVKGYDAGTEDGIFGLNTHDAVIEFQIANDLEPDGIIGPKTWNKLFT